VKGDLLIKVKKRKVEEFYMLGYSCELAFGNVSDPAIFKDVWLLRYVH